MDYEIIRYNACGMDVHKNTIVATIGITNRETGKTKYYQQSFSTLNPDLLKIVDWLKSYDCHDVCMESTGKYWIPIFNVLEDNDINVCLTHPKYVKAIKGKKTDKKDSKWICNLFKHDQLYASFIPSKDIRALRELCRYRVKLVYMRSSEKNRYQNCMTVSNIGLASILSDPFGKTASNIMEEVMNSSSINEKKILSLVHRRCKNKDKILDAIHGCNIESDQMMKLKLCKQHMDNLNEMIASIETEIFKTAVPLFDKFIHITDIKGITPLSAILIISEIGVDMEQFSSSGQLCSWAGLTPANNESANKKKSTRINKAGQYLKPLLVQCALASIKDPDSYYGRKYNTIKKRRGHKRAIIAIARKMLVAIYHMINSGESFNPRDYEEIVNPKSKKITNINQMEDKDILKVLAVRGYDISKLQKTDEIQQPIINS